MTFTSGCILAVLCPLGAAPAPAQRGRRSRTKREEEEEEAEVLACTNRMVRSEKRIQRGFLLRSRSVDFQDPAENPVSLSDGETLLATTSFRQQQQQQQQIQPQIREHRNGGLVRIDSVHGGFVFLWQTLVLPSQAPKLVGEVGLRGRPAAVATPGASAVLSCRLHGSPQTSSVIYVDRGCGTDAQTGGAAKRRRQQQQQQQQQPQQKLKDRQTGRKAKTGGWGSYTVVVWKSCSDSQ